MAHVKDTKRGIDGDLRDMEVKLKECVWIILKKYQLHLLSMIGICQELGGDINGLCYQKDKKRLGKWQTKVWDIYVTCMRHVTQIFGKCR